MKIIESTNIVEQFRFPRTKKRRIRNKWAKRPENQRPASKAVLMGDAFVCHPFFAARLRKEIAEQQAEADFINSVFNDRC